MHEANDELHGSAGTNTQWPYTNMCVAMAKPLITLRCRSSLPEQFFRYVHTVDPHNCLSITEGQTQLLLWSEELLQRGFCLLI